MNNFKPFAAAAKQLQKMSVGELSVDEIQKRLDALEA